MGRPLRWDKSPEGRKAIAVLNFAAYIPEIPEGGIHYGCEAFTPSRDRAYGWQDPTGLWHVGPERRRKWECSCGSFVSAGQKRYCERCSRSGLDPMLDFLNEQDVKRAMTAIQHVADNFADASPTPLTVEMRNGQAEIPSRFASMVA